MHNSIHGRRGDRTQLDIDSTRGELHGLPRANRVLLAVGHGDRPRHLGEVLQTEPVRRRRVRDGLGDRRTRGRQRRGNFSTEAQMPGHDQPAPADAEDERPRQRLRA